MEVCDRLSDDIETRLQAMYHSGQVTAYIISILPASNLATGWVEQGLVSKGLPSNLDDKNNQETLVIPIDRFAQILAFLDGMEHIWEATGRCKSLNFSD